MAGDARELPDIHLSPDIRSGGDCASRQGAAGKVDGTGNGAGHLYERQGITPARRTALMRTADIDRPVSLGGIILPKHGVQGRAAAVHVPAGRDQTDHRYEVCVVNTRLGDGDDEAAAGSYLETVTVGPGGDRSAHALAACNLAVDTIGMGGANAQAATNTD